MFDRQNSVSCEKKVVRANDKKRGREEEWKSEKWKRGRVEEWKSGRVEEWKRRGKYLHPNAAWNTHNLH